jgi:hypothetical protein
MHSNAECKLAASVAGARDVRRYPHPHSSQAQPASVPDALKYYWK